MKAETPPAAPRAPTPARLAPEPGARPGGAGKTLFDEAIERQQARLRAPAPGRKGAGEDRAGETPAAEGHVPVFRADGGGMPEGRERRRVEALPNPQASPDMAAPAPPASVNLPSTPEISPANPAPTLLYAFAERLALSAKDSRTSRLTLNERDFAFGDATISGTSEEGLSITCRQNGDHRDGEEPSPADESLRRRLEARGIRIRSIDLAP